MDLHYSQTGYHLHRYYPLFHYLMDLHYSQTPPLMITRIMSFTILWIYTILKPYNAGPSPFCGFTTLWIYTILKQTMTWICRSFGFTTLWIYTILKL